MKIRLIIKSQNPDFFVQLNQKTNNYNDNLKTYIDDNDIFSKITEKGKYKINDKDIQFKDLSLKYLNDITSGQLNDIKELDSLQLIDGFLNFENPSFTIGILFSKLWLKSWPFS